MKASKKVRNLAALLALTTALTTGLSACGTTTADTTAVGSASDSTAGTTTTPTEYKYGSVDIPGKDGALCGAPIYIAYENGYFAEEGFDVNLISADTETRKVGLNNGTIPIVNGDFQFFPSIEEGVNVSVVDGLHFGCIKFVVRTDSDIKTAEDLKGLTVGVDEIGGTPHQVASVWVEQAGLSADQNNGDVTFVPYSDGNLELEALYNGEIDVAALWDPFGSNAEASGQAKVIFDLRTDPTFAGKYCCFLYASNKILEENPEEVAALLRAYQKAQDWISKNPEETVDIIIEKKYAAVEDRDLAIELIKSYEYPSYEDREANANQVQENVRYFAEQLYNIGYLKTDSDAFTKKAYAEVDVSLGAESVGKGSASSTESSSGTVSLGAESVRKESASSTGSSSRAVSLGAESVGKGNTHCH